MTLKAFWAPYSMSNSSLLANALSLSLLNFAFTELKHVSIGFNSGEYETLKITVMFNLWHSVFTSSFLWTAS